MFGTIRRHQSWLWIVIIVVIIISFVVYFNPAQRSGNGSGAAGGNLPKIDGKVITPRMMGDAQREVRLLYFLNFRKWPEEDQQRAQQVGFDMENESYLRMLRVAKAQEAGIHIADTTVAEFAHRLLGDYTGQIFQGGLGKERFDCGRL